MGCSVKLPVVVSRLKTKYTFSPAVLYVCRTWCLGQGKWEFEVLVVEKNT